MDKVSAAGTIDSGLIYGRNKLKAINNKLHSFLLDAQHQEGTL